MSLGIENIKMIYIYLNILSYILIVIFIYLTGIIVHFIYIVIVNFNLNGSVIQWINDLNAIYFINNEMVIYPYLFIYRNDIKLSI